MTQQTQRMPTVDIASPPIGEEEAEARPMSGADLADALESIGWSVEAAARVWDVRRQTVQRWINERKPIPPEIANHATLLADFHDANPYRRPERLERAMSV